MVFNPDINHRRTIRLRDYDYSQNGAYFVTLCTRNRCCYFDQFEPLRRIVELQWQNIPERFPTVVLDHYVIMPNHIHAIIIIRNDDTCRQQNDCHTDCLQHNQKSSQEAPTLGEIVGAFKSLCANAWLKTIKSDNLDAIGTFWQNNYYEHIVRNDKELQRIRQYIDDNPLKWEHDPENPMVAKDRHGQTEQWMR